MNSIVDRILYGGFTKEEYQKHQSMILKNDIQNLSAYLIVACIGFMLLALASVISSGFAHINVSIYFCTALAFLITWLLLQLSSRFNGKASPINNIFIYLFMAILYTESIVLTILHPDMPSVTYIGILLVMPLLFAYNPLFMGISQCFFVLLFCLCMHHHKLQEIATVDIWNAITFLIVSIAVIVLVIPMRIRLMIQHEIVTSLYETDLLTGLRNRNSYELDCREIEAMPQKPLCVYADANGLHELNNRLGHEAGDKLLLAAADAIRKAFGEKYTYRIGGDEFIAFAFDCDMIRCNREVEQMINTLEAQGYHMSIGSAAPENPSETLDSIIKRAEKQMYHAKEEYYRTSGNDRRSKE